MRATPWPEGATTAPLLWQSNLSECYATIHDVPTSKLAQQTELSLVLLMDRPKQQMLLQVPNTKLNWKFHFGCRGDGREVADVLKSHGMEVQSLQNAGTMLFSFPPRVHDPMRIHVLEAQVDSALSKAAGGVWTKFNDIPYTEMWADDILWLPWFVESDDPVNFEGHFIFDGPPGPNSGLVAHNCQRVDAMEKE